MWYLITQIQFPSRLEHNVSRTLLSCLCTFAAWISCLDTFAAWLSCLCTFAVWLSCLGTFAAWLSCLDTFAAWLSCLGTFAAWLSREGFLMNCLPNLLTRRTWWTLFHKRVVRTKFDIYFLSIFSVLSSFMTYYQVYS